ncbi:MAG TPA: response regulator, partial [Burkholderiaceae bacterium]|nr:response regulator [Burkholderiaceae bacterium]
ARCGQPLAGPDIDAFAQIVERMRAMLDQFAAGREPQPEPGALAQADALAQRWADLLLARPLAPAPDATRAGRDPGATLQPEAAEDAPLDAAATVVTDDPVAALSDELDPELGPVFVHEADDYLPLIGDGLRQWAQEPSDPALPAALMRQLHTVKGSARMAGAMRLGQLVHEMETRVEAALALPRVSPALIEDLIARHDQVLALFDALKDPSAAAAAQRPVSGADAVAEARDDAPAGSDAAGDETEFAGAGAPLAAAGASAGSMIRVRADLLDKLVNEAGEVSIARARLENELATIRQALGDLNENVMRLRSQLREIELQADTQIQAHETRTREPDARFDPLEFDRYTRFQELTRMLAESVSDVSTVQQNAMRSLEEASHDLSRQGQVTRDLQQNLMRVRMVQFSTIADRLYRVVRQAAKELDKRVNLDLKGASSEIDRGVLERMAGPIEHLLRNAVVHGIESREQRVACGKAETGDVTLEVRLEGNEVTLTFSDDGAGLDYERIRARALERGLIDPRELPAERELAQLIFMPGFTTATEVTALAGRGVGMDAVRAEVAAMGGRIDIESQRGRGTRFTVHLPVSLAVAQVVLLTVSAARFAVPSALVEQVLQLKPETLAAAYDAHAIEWQGQQVPLYYFGSLLELADATPVAQRHSPVLVLRSGNQRIALHVDQVSPNQEVVVKHVGPQLARLVGIAGATVLGNGDIVLIVNPVQIALTRPSQQAGEGATASFAPTQIPVQPTVMVVDDSVTVRKFTQRLLAREGYQVVLAKDGVDALRQLQDFTPDAFLLDIEMPRMDGFDLTRNLRAEPRTAAVPIIMITSRTADKHRNHAMSLGVDVYLGKPYSEEALLRELRMLLAARRATA